MALCRGWIFLAFAARGLNYVLPVIRAFPGPKYKTNFPVAEGAEWLDTMAANFLVPAEVVTANVLCWLLTNANVAVQWRLKCY